MNHGEHLVDILDEQGNITGTKQRQEIDKERDFFRAAYIIALDGEGKIGLTRIPEKGEFGSKELFGGKWGCSAATILRHEEELEQAAKRSLKYDFQIEDAEVELLGETFETFADGVRRQLAVYKAVRPDRLEGLSYITADELDDWIADQPEKISPTLLVAWQRYKDALTN